MQLSQKQIRISEEDWGRLAAVAEERHLRPSQLVRVLILAYLEDMESAKLPTPVSYPAKAKNRLAQMEEEARRGGI